VVSSKKLGRGLASLLSERATSMEDFAPEEVYQAPLDEIAPNPYQPRDQAEGPELEPLVNSVRTHGVIQPLLVRRTESGYQIVAGERRWRAAQKAGLEVVPVVVRDADEDDMLALALVENLQRKDLNPIEKARAFKSLLERFSLTQAEAAKRLGMDRSTVANMLRLLELPKRIQDCVSRGTISMGHARALLGLSSDEERNALCDRIIREALSVRAVEGMIAARQPLRRRKAKGDDARDAYIRDLEDRFRVRLGCKVNLQRNRQSGRITIYFHNDDDLQRVIEIVGL